MLPADPSLAHRPKPWLLHSLPVNTLNFCAFSMCYGNLVLDRPPNSPSVAEDRGSSTGSSEPILIAVPARDDKKIEVYQFPDEKLVAVVPRIESSDTGALEPGTCRMQTSMQSPPGSAFPLPDRATPIVADRLCNLC